MKIISLYSIKGGVGKTAAAVNLSYEASFSGQTLLWDWDPQAASSFYLRVQPKIKGDKNKIITKKSYYQKNIKGTDFTNFDILPADFVLKDMDFILSEIKESKKDLKKKLHNIFEDYQYVFIDSPPSASVLSEYLMYISDIILVPLIPTVLSYRTFLMLKSESNKNKLDNKVMAFFSMVDTRKKLHKSLMEEIKKSEDNILDVAIPYSAIVEKMGLERAPVQVIDRKSKASLAYIALWENLVKTKL